jgi:putative flippase GtrA
MAFPKYIIAGGINTVVTYFIYLGFLLVMPYPWAYSITYGIGIVLGYILNAKWVFGAGSSLQTAVIYPLSYGINYILGVSMLWFMVEIIHLPKQIAPIIGLVISVPFMYIFTKAIFKKKHPNEKENHG